jgi:hypothetical protein
LETLGSYSDSLNSENDRKRTNATHAFVKTLPKLRIGYTRALLLVVRQDPQAQATAPRTLLDDV